MRTGTVHSSHCDITINMETGDVVEVQMHPGSTREDAATFAKIIQFDLTEYFNYYYLEYPSATKEFDILDLGYLSMNSRGIYHYEPPAADYRAKETA